MNLLITTLPGADTFAIVNDHRIRIGRDWQPVTADELTDRFARAFRELGADPHLMSDRAETVWGLAERADGMVDTYTVSIVGGMVHATYGWTITATGDRVLR